MLWIHLHGFVKEHRDRSILSLLCYSASVLCGASMVIPPSRMELAFSFRVEKVLEISSVFSCIVLGHQVINAQIYEYSFSGPVYKGSRQLRLKGIYLVRVQGTQRLGGIYIHKLA